MVEVVDFGCDSHLRTSTNFGKISNYEAIELAQATFVEIRACSVEAVSKCLSDMHHCVGVVEVHENDVIVGSVGEVVLVENEKEEEEEDAYPVRSRPHILL